MEIPSRVSIFNPLLELKGKQGTLLSVDESGFYEVAMEVSGNQHTVFLPVAQTVLIVTQPTTQVVADFEIER